MKTYERIMLVLAGLTLAAVPIMFFIHNEFWTGLVYIPICLAGIVGIIYLFRPNLKGGLK